MKNTIPTFEEWKKEQSEQAASSAKGATAFLLMVIATTFLICCIGTCSADAQTVTRDAAGNYTAAPREVKVERDSITGLSYTDAQGKVYPVYKGAKGSHYVCRVSKKTGKFYRQYLKSED